MWGRHHFLKWLICNQLALHLYIQNCNWWRTLWICFNRATLSKKILNLVQGCDPFGVQLPSLNLCQLTVQSRGQHVTIVLHAQLILHIKYHPCILVFPVLDYAYLLFLPDVICNFTVHVITHIACVSNPHIKIHYSLMNYWIDHCHPVHLISLSILMHICM